VLTFSARLKRAILIKDMPRKALVIKSGVCPATISKILREGRQPQYETAARLARALDVPFRWLFYGMGQGPVDDDDMLKLATVLAPMVAKLLREEG
jgi:transcriptional regulator with XRE-family HTH domain